MAGDSEVRSGIAGTIYTRNAYALMHVRAGDSPPKSYGSAITAAATTAKPGRTISRAMRPDPFQAFNRAGGSVPQARAQGRRGS